MAVKAGSLLVVQFSSKDGKVYSLALVTISLGSIVFAKNGIKLASLCK